MEWTLEALKIMTYIGDCVTRGADGCAQLRASSFDDLCGLDEFEAARVGRVERPCVGRVQCGDCGLRCGLDADHRPHTLRDEVDKLEEVRSFWRHAGRWTP